MASEIKRYASILVILFLLSILPIENNEMSLKSKTKENYIFGNFSNHSNNISNVWQPVGHSGVSNSQSGASFGYNSTTNETHVLTYSSPSPNSNRDNSKLVFGTFDSNGTLSNLSYYNFSSNYNMHERNFHVTPSGVVYVYASIYQSGCGTYNVQTGWHGKFFKSAPRNISTMTAISSGWECSYQSGWGFVGNNETVTHIGQRTSQFNYNQGYVNRAITRLIDMKTLTTHMIQCSANAGCGVPIFSGALTEDNITIISYKDGTNRLTKAWAAENNSEWFVESGNDAQMIAFSQNQGALMLNSSHVYSIEILSGAKNTSINQSIFSELTWTSSNDRWDQWKIDERGHWQSGYKFFNPFTGREINYSLSNNAWSQHLGNGAFLTKTGGVEIYDYDRDGFQSGIVDNCINSNPNYWGPDYDADGCYDIEDDDIDGDGILNTLDPFPYDLCGDTDTDGDGMPDILLCPSSTTQLVEDLNDDNDSFNDTDDYCPIGFTNWSSSTQGLDYDNDGCHDFVDDSDDDNDNIQDLSDLCPTGSLNRSLNLNWTDNDNDGCEDIAEDLDDDNDGTNDAQDFWPNDPEAYGADTDGDLLPNEIHLINENITMDHTFQYLQAPSWFYPVLDDYPKVDFGYNQNWMISSILNSTSPLAFAESPTSPTNIVQNNPALFFNFRGEGTIEVEYFKDNIDCKFDIHVDGYTFSMSDGWNNFSQIVGFGNHNIQFDYYENYSYSDCDSTSLQLYRIILPLAGETDAGLQADEDDDDDGYLDHDETSGVCLILSSPVDNQSIPPDVDADYICDALDDDIDDDGFNNSNDAFPYDVNATIDSDNDGMPDVINGNSTTGLFEDMDDDNDGFNDSIDSWPLDNCVGEDHDSDGLSDNVVLGCQTNILEDGDDDNDNKLDQDDFCPTGKLNWLSGAVTDNDGDGCRDSDEDLDDDNDGLLDTVDLCPQGYVGWISNPSVDQDSDGCHDLIEDNDDDNDGVTEPGDQCPNTPANVTVDSQGCPIDTDSDGVADYLDNCANTPVGVIVDSNGCPVDTDGDGVPDYLDEFPLDPSETTDSDGDGAGDNSDAFPNDASETLDSDGDGVGDNTDAFPNDASEILDSDGDGVGDNTDAFPANGSETLDSDGDGVGDNTDAFPNDANETVDSDGDGVGDNTDAFPADANETIDSDSDGIGDNSDAFPNDANETIDSDSDGVGDNLDAFPNDANETLDSDGDGIGDNSDKCSETSLNQVVQSDGCVESSASFADEIPTIAIGVSSLGIIAIATTIILLRRRKDELDAKEFIEHTIEEFEPQESHQDLEEPPLVEESVSAPEPEHPPILNEGQKGDDGYYWLEWPADSGKWYYRGLPEEEWSIWDN